MLVSIKSDVKKFLRSKGVKTITLASGKTVKIQSAKTSDLVSVASKMGY